MQSLRDCKFGEHNQREMIKRLEKLELTDLLSTLQRNLSDRKEQGKEMPTLPSAPPPKRPLQRILHVQVKDRIQRTVVTTKSKEVAKETRQGEKVPLLVEASHRIIRIK